MSNRTKGYSIINNVNITFETVYFVENAANVRLAVSGSTPELGSWNVADCLLARESSPGSGRWSVSVVMSPEEQFQWKWVVISPDRRSVNRWEEMGNREENSGSESMTIFAGWNGESVVLTHTQHNFITQQFLWNGLCGVGPLILIIVIIYYTLFAEPPTGVFSGVFHVVAGFLYSYTKPWCPLFQYGDGELRGIKV